MRRFFSRPLFAPSVSALRFPSNISGSDNTAPYAVIQFANPHTDGLPIWGPGGAGVTVFRRIKTYQQTGYYAQFWYSSSGDFSENYPPPLGYWGFHPYPTSQSNAGTVHEWEIAIDQGDYRASGRVAAAPATVPTGPAVTVVHGVWSTQALRVQRISANEKLLTFYLNLPSTADADIVEVRVNTTNYGETTVASPLLTIGDSPWYSFYQHERASCDIAQQMIVAKAMAEADIATQGSNLNQLNTADSAANIWWGKRFYSSVNDLTCDFGTGRAFVRNDSSNLLTVVEAA
ncbi:MAG: hypothetical protein SFV24_19175 [Gemmatimonadales bacterium]|nr:hypothetical protein [Gemmatimonadales bacterium]